MLPRILSALFLIPAFLLLLFKAPPLLFTAFVMLLSLGLLYEWHGLFPPFSRSDWLWQGTVACLWLGLVHAGLQDLLLVVLPVSAFLLFARNMASWRVEEPMAGRLGVQFFGLIYCVLPLAVGLLLRLREGGASLIFFVLSVIWATDSGAYFFGRLLGKRKMTPTISPGKTWAGLMGGTFSAVLVGVAMTIALPLSMSITQVLFFSLIIALVGQLGDLAESVLKREAGVKDSGRLIPGHGGLLDRLDSMLFVLPLFFLFLMVGEMF